MFKNVKLTKKSKLEISIFLSYFNTKYFLKLIKLTGTEVFLLEMT